MSLSPTGTMPTDCNLVSYWSDQNQGVCMAGNALLVIAAAAIEAVSWALCTDSTAKLWSRRIETSPIAYTSLTLVCIASSTRMAPPSSRWVSIPASAASLLSGKTPMPVINMSAFISFPSDRTTPAKIPSSWLILSTPMPVKILTPCFSCSFWKCSAKGLLATLARILSAASITETTIPFFLSEAATSNPM